MAAYEAKIASIKNDPSLSGKLRNRQIQSLKPNPDWIVKHAYLWALQGQISFTTAHVNTDTDLAILKLENFDLTGITYPVFKNPLPDIRPGTSVCRLGFPFNSIEATFNEASGQFSLENFSVPPMFPNDGIHTRMAVLPSAISGGPSARFIETSTPGLRGQSGGPVFDKQGMVWGIQSSTAYLELGFSAKKNDNGKEFVEHQFMGVGLVSHVSHVIELFDQYGVSYCKE